MVALTQEAEFKKFPDIVNAGPKVCDGFYSARDRLLVLTTRRTDNDYDLVSRTGEPLFKKGMDQKDMLRGIYPTPMPGQPPIQPEQVIQAMEFALILKHMDQDGERATLSHDGTRQLLYAVGFLPRNVMVPEWVQYGLASFFETPLGSPWGSFGQPSYVHVPAMKDLKRAGKLEGSNLETMLKVVKDAYFRQAALSKGGEMETTRAQATAWSLCYFLMRKELPKLQAYCRELSRMPRDLELDEEALLGCFARAFNAWDAERQVPRTAELEKLAERWHRDVNEVDILFKDAQELQTFVTTETAKIKKAIEKGTLGNPNPMGGP
jgi:hypothetical protein